MKKLIALLLALVMVLSLVACSTKEKTPEVSETPSGDSSTPATEEKSGEETPAATEGDANAESETPMVIQWDQTNTTDLLEPPYMDGTLSYHTYFLWSRLWVADQSKQPTDPDYYVWHVGSGWEANEDATEFKLTVRDDAVWTDGEPVTADDVAFTIMANIMDPTSAYPASYKQIEGYEDLTNGKADTLSGMVVDGNTITFTLSAPNANFRPNPFVLPAHCFEGISWNDMSTAEYWKNPVTCGPYRVSETSFPDYFKMTRFENYFGKPAGIKNVTAISFETSGVDAAVASMIAGESDITSRTVTSSGVIANQIADGNPDCVIKSMYSNDYRALIFNMGNRTDGKDKAALVNDASARLAISLLVDEDTIGHYVAGEACKIPGNPINPNVPSDWNEAEKSLDLEKAKSLLDAAGWNYDDEIDILCYYTDQVSRDVLEIIKADAAKIGVKVNINVVAENPGAAIYDDRNFDLLFFMNGGSTTSPAFGVGQYLGTDAENYVTMTEWIPEKYAPLYDALVAAEDGSAEQAAATKALYAANQEDVLIIPIYVQSMIMTYNTAHIYVPETAFDYFDNNFDLDQWQMLH